MKITDLIRPLVLLKDVTGLTGGTTGKLDAVQTVEMTAPVTGWFIIGSDVEFYRLRAGTDTENSPEIIRPDDYSDVTNEKVWEKLNFSSIDLSAVKLDDLAAPDDNTDLNSSASAHGLLRKLDGVSTNYLSGDGLWRSLLGAVKLDDSAAPDDNTDLNASVSSHGLLPKLSGSSGKYLGGDGNWHDLPIQFNLFLTDASSDIGGYKALSQTPPTEAETSVSAALPAADTVIEEWAATAADSPDFISEQVLHVHFHAAKTAGTKAAVLYVKVYKRATGGAETLLGTSDNSTPIGSTAEDVNAHVTVSDTEMLTTDRIVIKVFGTPSGGGTTPTVALHYRGNTSSRIELGNAAPATPALHAGTHQSGGSDSIKLDDLSAPDDNTDLNVSISAHGLCPKAPNDASKVLLGTGAFGDPPAATPYRHLWIGAEAMVARTTNGAAAGSTESSTNKIMSETFDFDASTAEYVQFKVALPDEWDRSTVKVKVFWTFASSSGDVKWSIAAGAYSNDDAIDSALGTAVTVTDTALTAGDVHVTSATGALTVGGSPALGDLLWFEVSRVAADGADTLGADAKLLGIQIQYKEGTAASAW